jgi:hypothetical protein
MHRREEIVQRDPAAALHAEHPVELLGPEHVALLPRDLPAPQVRDALRIGEPPFLHVEILVDPPGERERAVTRGCDQEEGRGEQQAGEHAADEHDPGQLQVVIRHEAALRGADVELPVAPAHLDLAAGGVHAPRGIRCHDAVVENQRLLARTPGVGAPDVQHGEMDMLQVVRLEHAAHQLRDAESGADQMNAARSDIRRIPVDRRRCASPGCPRRPRIRMIPPETRKLAVCARNSRRHRFEGRRRCPSRRAPVTVGRHEGW